MGYKKKYKGKMKTYAYCSENTGFKIMIRKARSPSELAKKGLSGGRNLREARYKGFRYRVIK